MVKPKKENVKPIAGSVQVHGDAWTLRVRIAGRQQRIKLGKVSEMSEARARETGAAWCERMAIEQRGAAPSTPAGTTVKAHFEAWTSGALFERYGAVNGLKPKRPGNVDGGRSNRYLKPIATKAVVDVTEEDIDRVMGGIPAARRAATRKNVYALLHRGFELAIVPARLRKDNPVRSYHRPAKDAPKLFAYLFPAELLALLRCAHVPLGRRVLYALAVYTGLRKSSLLALCWSAVDWQNGMLLSRVSKTGIAQMFEIPRGLVWVLRRWYELSGRPDDAAAIIPTVALCIRAGGRPQRGLPRSEAAALRADLVSAGVTRSALFAEGSNVEPLRFHDMRATLVTWGKRAGKSDGWIADRTGHMTPEMIERYTRAARTLEDLKIEPFPELEGTIPEFASLAGGSSAGDQGTTTKTGPSRSGGGEGGAAGPTGGLEGVVPPVPTRAQACAHADLDVVKRGLDKSKRPRKQDHSAPFTYDSGSSGVTLVRVQVPPFAQARNR